MTRSDRFVCLSLIFTTSLCLLVLAWRVHAAERARWTDDLETRLSVKNAHYDLGRCTPIQALLRVSSDFHIPMGISWVNTSGSRATFPFRWENATVREIIESIGNLGYTIEFQKQIVHISGDTSVPYSQNFLWTRIESFEVHAQHPRLAELQLHDMLAPPRYGGVSIGVPSRAKITLDIKHTDVRSILDALAVSDSSGGRNWLVAFSEEQAATAKGFRRTISLWSAAIPPDKDQPVWTFLDWGAELPPVLGDRGRFYVPPHNGQYDLQGLFLGQRKRGNHH